VSIESGGASGRNRKEGERLRESTRTQADKRNTGKERRNVLQGEKQNSVALLLDKKGIASIGERPLGTAEHRKAERSASRLRWKKEYPHQRRGITRGGGTA